LSFGLLVVEKENMVMGEVENGKKAMGNDDGKKVEMSKDGRRDEKVVRVSTKGYFSFQQKKRRG
jgi:hypothetical protein